MKSTAERILDAAEHLFAEQGYSATSLGDVADRVGIRAPSLYNHFRNKEALYTAVVERLLNAFTGPLEEHRNGDLTPESILYWLETIVGLHHEHPNLSRLLQHAALSGGPDSAKLVERLFRPMFEPIGGRNAEHDFNILGNPALQPWGVMALNNMVMSYITMAPMYEEVMGIDLMSPKAQKMQQELIQRLARAALDLPEDKREAGTNDG